MSQGIEVCVCPVKDLGAAKALYAKLLGVEPYIEQPYYVGFRSGGCELGLDPNGHAKGMTGPVAYWKVADLNATLQDLVAAGAFIQQDVSDVGGGKLVASVKDAEGNVVGLIQAP